MRAEPVLDEAALLVGDTIIVADLHIGIEEYFKRSGYRVPNLTRSMNERLVALIKKHRAKKVVILGDLKHSIVGSEKGERYDVKEFVRSIMDLAHLTLVKGNHDGGLQYLADRLGFELHSPKGFKLGDIGLAHGHAHPSEEVMGSKMFVMAHEHPVARLTDRLGFGTVMKCWLKTGFTVKKMPRQFIVMPAFNDYLGGTPMNDKEGKFISPLMKNKSLDLKNAGIYLLDGTFLGKRKDLIDGPRRDRTADLRVP